MSKSQKDIESDFKNEAIRIAKILSKSCNCYKNGALTWDSSFYIYEKQEVVIKEIDNYLFNGLCGILFYLACVSKITNMDYSSLIYRGLNYLKEELRYSYRNKLIGGFFGLSSIPYSIFHIGHLIDDQKVMHDAIQILLSISHELIDQDKQYDLIFGSAGVISVCLSLFNIQQDMRLLLLSEKCANHLICNLNKWALNKESLISGLSHGISGIIYSLNRLNKYLKNDMIVEVTEMCIKSENTLFVDDEKNWKNTNISKEYKIGKSWCYGAPGICLCRNEIDTLYNKSVNYKKDIRTAITTTINFRKSRVDTLCCGNCGRYLILSRLAQNKTNDIPENYSIIKSSNILNETLKNHRGYYSLFSYLPRSHINPGLMQGLSGIGYTYLKLIDKKNLLPFILLLE